MLIITKNNSIIDNNVINFYCYPVKNAVNKELGLTLLTRYQPFWLSLFWTNINITMGKDSHFTGQQ